jgi:hypothetical protein
MGKDAMCQTIIEALQESIGNTKTPKKERGAHMKTITRIKGHGKSSHASAVIDLCPIMRQYQPTVKREPLQPSEKLTS